jgi:hypothetical protein
MLLSTVLNLIFIPVLYVILSRVLGRGGEADKAKVTVKGKERIPSTQEGFGI